LLGIIFQFFLINNKIQSEKCKRSRLFKRQLNDDEYFGTNIKNKQIISWWSKRFLTWTLLNHPPTLSWNETINAFEKGKFLKILAFIFCSMIKII